MVKIPKTREEAVGVITSSLKDNIVEEIRIKLANINPILFGDNENNFRSLITYIYETESLAEIKVLIGNFLNKLKVPQPIIIKASQLFIKKFNAIKDKSTQREIQDLILRLSEKGRDYPTETIGGYFISPRGHHEKRIVWRLERNNLVFEDLFISHKEYDDFCDKLRAGKLDTSRRFANHNFMQFS